MSLLSGRVAPSLELSADAGQAMIGPLSPLQARWAKKSKRKKNPKSYSSRELPKVEVEPQMPTLPTQAALKEAVDTEEVLAQLCAWVAAGRRSGRLAVEVAKLDPEHRRVITAFVIAGKPSSQTRSSTPAGRRSTSLVQKFSFGRSSSVGASRARAAPQETKRVSHEQFYVLQALAEVGDVWFDRQGDANRSLVSRALAQLPRAD